MEKLVENRLRKDKAKLTNRLRNLKKCQKILIL